MMRRHSDLMQYQHALDRERHEGLFAPTAREEWRSVLGFKGDGYNGEYGMKLKSSIAFPELDYLMLDFGQLGLISEEGVWNEDTVEEGEVEAGVNVSSFFFFFFWPFPFSHFLLFFLFWGVLWWVLGGVG